MMLEVRPISIASNASQRQKERDLQKQISLFDDKKPPEEMKQRWSKTF